MSHPSPDRRSILLAVIGAVVSALLLVPVFANGGAAPGVPMAEQRVGTCHDQPTVEEFYTHSDARPAVECAAPHRSETVALRNLPERWAQRDEPISLEAQQVLAPTLECGYGDIARYVGSDALNPHWFITTEVRFPTEAQWERGERRYRCDAVAAVTTGTDRPTRTGTLRRIMERPASAVIRPCLAGAVLVPCSEPHDSEVVGPGGPLDGAERKQFEQAACPKAGRSFLGGAPRRGLRIAVIDDRPGSVLCVVTIEPGHPLLEGTLAAQARGTTS